MRSPEKKYQDCNSSREFCGGGDGRTERRPKEEKPPTLVVCCVWVVLCRGGAVGCYGVSTNIQAKIGIKPTFLNVFFAVRGAWRLAGYGGLWVAVIEKKPSKIGTLGFTTPVS